MQCTRPNTAQAQGVFAWCYKGLTCDEEWLRTSVTWGEGQQGAKQSVTSTRYMVGQTFVRCRSLPAAASAPIKNVRIAPVEALPVLCEQLLIVLLLRLQGFI
jgi:hypothetical protein